MGRCVSVARRSRQPTFSRRIPCAPRSQLSPSLTLAASGAVIAAPVNYTVDPKHTLSQFRGRSLRRHVGVARQVHRVRRARSCWTATPQVRHRGHHHRYRLPLSTGWRLDKHLPGRPTSSMSRNFRPPRTRAKFTKFKDGAPHRGTGRSDPARSDQARDADTALVQVHDASP